MGLEEFTTDNEHGVGEITTRKKIENVSLPKDAWLHLLYHNPVYASYFAGQLGDSETKAMVQIMDQLIEEGSKGTKRYEERRNEIKGYRDEVVEEYIKD